MDRLPITSTYSPAPSFFRRQRRPSLSLRSSSDKSSSSLFTATDSSDDSSVNDSDDSTSESGASTSTDDDEFERANLAAAAWSIGTLGSQINRQHQSQTAPHQRPTVASTSSRSQLRLSLAILRCRQALAKGQYETLATSLTSLKGAMPSDLSSLGIFIPILERLARTLNTDLVELGGKDFRKTLTKSDAKALIALQQRWTLSTDGDAKIKGKARHVDSDWVTPLRDLVERTPPPISVQNAASRGAKLVLDGLEQMLLPSALPKLSVAGLSLTSKELESIDALREANDVIEWYASFGPEAGRQSGAQILHGLRTLDLSKNRLDSLPSFLHRLFPCVETLNLTNNAFLHMPPSILLWSSLRRVKTRGNLLAKHGKTKVPRLHPLPGLASTVDAPTRSNTREIIEILRVRLDALSVIDFSASRVPSLVSISIQKARALVAFSETLPIHLAEAVNDSYVCASCSRAIDTETSPLLHLPALFERVHHLDPGVVIPRQQTPHSDVTTDYVPNEGRSSTPSPSSSFRNSISIEERVMLALYGRNTTIETFVIGDEQDYRFCAFCAISHLNLSPSTCNQRCKCLVCVEERRVRGESDRSDDGPNVLRWLRKKSGTKGRGV
ncbi:hypothetical protein OIO90_002376 [Microbotryomycetes sp. JL221]|nr:hypothetical protein OIO90_002376 [Microbotryomycetes sp. JL221]